MSLLLQIIHDFAEVMAYEQFRPGILDLEGVLAAARRASLRSTEPEEAAPSSRAAPAGY